MADYSHNTDDLTPQMTANDAPSPNVVSSINYSGIGPAWDAFDHSVAFDHGWLSANGTTTGWLKFDLGAGNAKAAGEYTLTGTTNVSGYAPKTWTLQGSNNDSDWTTLDTQTNVAAWTAREMRTYNISNPAAYRYYKLDITANQGSAIYLEVAELELIEAITITANITNPSMSASGFTGIDARDVTSPLMSASGYTGIDSRDVASPSMSVKGFTGIYSSLSLPMIRANATLSDNMIHIESSLTIPSMTATITQAKQIWGNISAPMMTAEITERETVLGNVTVPMMTVELASGIHVDIEVTTPMMTTEGIFSNQCEVTLPMMTVEVEGIVGRVINSDIRLPMVTVEMAGKTEHLVNCDISVPTMRVVADLMTGKIITGATTLPMMEAALTSYEDITGDIDAFVPMMEAYMVATAERAECAVLRYLEPAL